MLKGVWNAAVCGVYQIANAVLGHVTDAKSGSSWNPPDTGGKPELASRASRLL